MSQMIRQFPGVPVGKALIPRRKRRFLQYPDRIQAVEAALAQCVPEPQIRRKLAAQFGVTEKMVNAYMVEVRARWREDAEACGANSREARRDEFRMMLKTIMQRAMTGEMEDDGTGKVKRGKRDLRAVTQALKLWGQLDGLNEAPPEVSVSQSNYFVNGLGITRLGFKDRSEVQARIAELKNRMLTEGVGFMHGPVDVPVEEGEE